MNVLNSLLACLPGLLPALAAAQESTFTVSGEGWTNVTLPCGSIPCPPPTNPPTEIGGPTAFTLQASGGNPGGWISAIDPDGAGAGNSQYWRAPAAFLGNDSAKLGGSLKYDILQTSAFASYQQEDVFLVGGGLTLSATTQVAPVPGVWTTYVIPIQVGTWRVGGTSGPLATEAQLKTVLADLTVLYLRAEYQLNVDTFGLDNVAFQGLCGAGLAASELARLGFPANPSAFKVGVTSGPVVGQTWDPVIDHATFMQAAIVDVLAITAFPANIPSVLGTILCDITTAPLILFLKPPGVPFAVSIPADCSLVGATLCSQAGSADASSIALTNALDITIGTY